MKAAVFGALLITCLVLAPSAVGQRPGVTASLRAGAAVVSITPFGQNREWNGPVTTAGVWGERFTDTNGNGRWDAGEPFDDDAANSALDASSKGKYDGIYLAGFGQNRLATGRHDDLWARTLVLDQGNTRIAVVSLDLIGYYSDASYYGIARVRAALDPSLGIDEILVASTHNHEGPDTIGPWGAAALADGKFPQYLQFVDRMIARSIAQAAGALRPARLRLGRTTPERSPSLARLQTRNANRPPRVFDRELRVMQFVAANGGARPETIATLVNWNTHPESMEAGNTLLTSDFPHTVRDEVERRVGGTALYISGAIGAVEIIGDTKHEKDERTRFDGRDFPLAGKDGRPQFTFERMEAIGRDIARAAVDALDGAAWSSPAPLAIRKADLTVPLDNAAYQILQRLSVLDVGTTAAGQPVVSTTIYVIELGDAQIVTTPGELFPEVYFGVATHRRRDCPAADTGRPPEPSIHDALTRPHRFVFGLCPDELGYIVPAYDFLREPFDAANPRVRRAPDPCKADGVPDHYHETNSASAVLAPATACVTVALVTGKRPDDAACRGMERFSEYLRSLDR